MVIKNIHHSYLNNSALLEFIGANNIKIYNKDTDSMVSAINEYAEKNEDNLKKVRRQVVSWLEEGRKKILFRCFYTEAIGQADFQEDKGKIESIFPNMKSLDLADLSVPASNMELWNIKYLIDNNKITSIKFTFVERIKQKQENTEAFNEIAVPVIVIVDLINNEIYAKVESKSNLYKTVEKSYSDVKIAQDALELVMESLEENKEINGDHKKLLQDIVFSIHEEITSLPEEILELANTVDEQIEQFVDDSVEIITILNQEEIKKDLRECIKNVIIKHVIEVYPDTEVFITNKYAISNGLDGLGMSMSSFRYTSPAKGPVQCDPEYQDIRNIVNAVAKIKRSVLYWNSPISEKKKFRMKMNVHKEGYILICYEQYVHKEEEESVFSKIREFKGIE